LIGSAAVILAMVLYLSLNLDRGKIIGSIFHGPLQMKVVVAVTVGKTNQLASF